MSKKRIIEEQATTDIFNDDWLVKDSVTQGTTKIQPSVFKAWINDGMATEEDIETIVENIADTYSTSESYAEGDLCIHEYALFKCIGATTGTWDSTKWEATTIAEIISTIDLSAEAISYDNASSGLEAENVQDAIDETITKLSAVGSASGDIATFSDGSDLAMKSLKVAIEPQQDLHGYDAPWVGGAGKNKAYVDNFNSTVVGNLTVSGSNETLSINGTANETISANNNIWKNIKVKITTAGKYYLKTFGTIPSGMNILYYDSLGNIIAPSSNGNDLAVGDYTIGVYIPNGTAFSNAKFTFQVQTESIATAWQPYSNICPIIGWSEAKVGVVGKNICEGVNGFLISYSAQTGVATRITGTGTCLVTHVKEGYTYTFSNGENVNRRIVTYWDSTPSIGDSTSYAQSLTGNTFTAIKDGLVIIYIYNASIDTSIAQIELGSTATAYEPYNGTTYTIDLDGTRYGGTLDVVSGVLTVDRAIKLVSECTWYGSNGVFYTDKAISTIKKGDGRYDHCISDAYKTYNIASTTPLPDGGISVDASGYIQLKDLRYSSPSDFKTAMGTTQLVYELATPTTIQLTPTQVKSLLGVNNVWADCGDVDVSYVRDLTTTINYILEQLNS